MASMDVNAILSNSAKTAQSLNNSAFNDFSKNAKSSSEFMQQLFNQLSPNTQNALNTNYQIGSELATTGSTKAAKNALDYYRRLGLETAAGTGAPVSSQFSQNLGGSLAVNQILQNQIQGTNILSQNASQQNSMMQTYIAPAMETMRANFLNPNQYASMSLQGATYNNQIENQNRMIDFANSQGMSWFDNILANTMGSAISTPFSLIQNQNSLTANSPQLAYGLAQSFLGGSAGKMAMI